GARRRLRWRIVTIRSQAYLGAQPARFAGLRRETATHHLKNHVSPVRFRPSAQSIFAALFRRRFLHVGPLARSVKKDAIPLSRTGTRIRGAFNPSSWSAPHSSHAALQVHPVAAAHG